MRCTVLTRGLFKSGDDYKKNDIKLNQEINQIKEQHKAQADKICNPEKQLLEEKTKRKKSEAKNQQLQSTVTKKSEEMKSTQESNGQLQKALQKAQINVQDVCDDAFDKEKTQVLCLHPRLDFSELDFFKVVVDGYLVDMKETEPSSADDRTKEYHADGTNLLVVNKDNNEE